MLTLQYKQWELNVKICWDFIYVEVAHVHTIVNSILWHKIILLAHILNWYCILTYVIPENGIVTKFEIVFVDPQPYTSPKL